MSQTATLLFLSNARLYVAGWKLPADRQKVLVMISRSSSCFLFWWLAHGIVKILCDTWVSWHIERAQGLIHCRGDTVCLMCSLKNGFKYMQRASSDLYNHHHHLWTDCTIILSSWEAWELGGEVLSVQQSKQKTFKKQLGKCMESNKILYCWVIKHNLCVVMQMWDREFVHCKQTVGHELAWHTDVTTSFYFSPMTSTKMQDKNQRTRSLLTQRGGSTAGCFTVRHGSTLLNNSSECLHDFKRK